MKDAKSVGMRMNLTSAYRTYMKQVYLFKNKIERLEREGYSHEKAVKEAGTSLLYREPVNISWD